MYTHTHTHTHLSTPVHNEVLITQKRVPCWALCPTSYCYVPSFFHLTIDLYVLTDRMHDDWSLFSSFQLTRWIAANIFHHRWMCTMAYIVCHGLYSVPWYCLPCVSWLILRVMTYIVYQYLQCVLWLPLCTVTCVPWLLLRAMTYIVYHDLYCVPCLILRAMTYIVCHD